MSSLTGQVVHIERNRGFAFIRNDGMDYFFHFEQFGDANEIPFAELQVGDNVTFEAVPSERGPRAMRVVVQR